MSKKQAARTIRNFGMKNMAIMTAGCAVLYFAVVCLLSSATIKAAAMGTAVLAILASVLRFSRLRERMSIPLLLLAAMVLMDGASSLYAVAGKFGLYEFLKVLASFCLAMTLLALAPGEGTRPGLWIARILAGYSAIAGLVSIDLISTRLLSGAVLGLIGLVNPDYTGLAGVEAGVRMTSLFTDANVFAGVTGLGVLLSLSLVRAAGNGRDRAIQTVILYINALSFLLAFSMGATASVAAAFLVLLLLERKEGRAGLFLLMLETLILSVLAAAVISLTSFGSWSGIQPIPLLCAAAGAAMLCVLDRFVGRPLAERLAGKEKLLPILVAVILIALVIFAFAACNFTGAASVPAGGSLRRATYPDAGTYTLSVEADGPVTVTVESQNQQETMMHTGSVLYRGEAGGASFTVPEDSLVVYFNFYAPDGADIRAVTYGGQNGSGSVPLDYKLLPGFIANRLQGILANENAIQRLVFFSDGIKLFRQSPLIGLGLGAFENGIKSVQNFYYETKYAHNHYIQALVETGIIGLALFVLLLVGCAAAVLLERRKGETAHPLTPALGAALVFMAVEATAEIVFSTYPFLPIALGVFALTALCCGGALPRPDIRVRTLAVSAVSVLVGIFACLLGCNMYAQKLVSEQNTMPSLVLAAELDKFEWADYAVSYVASTAYVEMDDSIRARADEYAARLEKQDSNIIPYYLADYYFRTEREEEAFAMLEKYVNYVASDPDGWQRTFELAARYYTGDETCRNGVLRLADRLDAWNEANMGTVELEGVAKDLVTDVRATAGR